MKLSHLVRPVLSVAVFAAAGCFFTPSVSEAAPPPRPVPAPIIVVTGANSVISGDTALPDNLNGTDFGRVTVGTTETRSFNIFNTGDADLVVTVPLTISGTNGSAFSTISEDGDVVHGTDGAPTTSSLETTVKIKPRQVMKFDVGFFPIGGPNSASLTINSNAAANPFTFSLKGEGVDGSVTGKDLKLVSSQYKTYQFKGKYPRLGVRVKGNIVLSNLTVDTVSNAIVRTYVSKNPYLDSNSIQISEIFVKNIKGKVNGKGIFKTKKATFKALAPELYEYVLSEVVPADANGNELSADQEKNYSNNATNWKYGWLTEWQYGHNLPGSNWTWGPFYRFNK